MIFLFLSLMIVLGGLSPDIYHLDTHLPLTAGTKRLFQISERYAAFRRKRLHNRFMRKRKGWKAFLPAFFFHHLATVYVAASSVMASGGANSAGSATPECAHNELSGYSASSVEKNDPRNDNAIHDFHDNDEEMGRGRESELPTASAETSSSFRALLRSHPH
eukprot:gene4630-5072_t